MESMGILKNWASSFRGLTQFFNPIRSKKSGR